MAIIPKTAPLVNGQMLETNTRARCCVEGCVLLIWMLTVPQTL